MMFSALVALGIETVNLLSLDIEGAEFQVKIHKGGDDMGILMTRHKKSMWIEKESM